MSPFSYALGGGAGNTGTAAPGCSKDTNIGQLMTYQSLEGASWGDIMTNNVRVVYEYDIAPEEASDFRVWQDMADEPAKYGDDICDWLDLDESPDGRWRRAAYWVLREAREMVEEVREEARLAQDQAVWRALFAPIAKKAATTCADRRVSRDIKAFVSKIRNAVVTIQSAWRGYAVRRENKHRDCCMCLAHVDCPLRTDVGYMCRACGEDGPHVDLVENDPWNWFRGDYVDEAATCGWCRAPLDEGRFCDQSCVADHHKDIWRDRR